MYSMVLMMAVAGSGDVASFGHKSRGCDGGAGCWGAGAGYAAGCWGGDAYAGCSGGGKHHGRSGGGFLGHKNRNGCDGGRGGFLGGLFGHKNKSCHGGAGCHGSFAGAGCHGGGAGFAGYSAGCHGGWAAPAPVGYGMPAPMGYGVGAPAGCTGGYAAPMYAPAPAYGPAPVYGPGPVVVPGTPPAVMPKPEGGSTTPPKGTTGGTGGKDGGAMAPATLTITAPAYAAVTVDGVNVVGGSDVRRFITLPVESANLTVKADVNGRQVTKTVAVKGGQEVKVDLTATDAVAGK